MTPSCAGPRCCEGVLLGGNLDSVATAAGWALPSLRGAILLLEADGMGLGHVDRQLTTLHKAGHLAGVVGVAVGQFTGIEPSTASGSLICSGIIWIGWASPS